MSGEETHGEQGSGLESEPRIAVSRLNWAGRPSEAVEVADRLLAELSDPREILGVQLGKLSTLLNADRLRECPAVIDAAWTLIQGHDARAADVGEFHALAAFFAYREGSLERCITDLVRGAQALEAVPLDISALRPWLSMAVTYSYVGFHRHAVAAHQHAEHIGRLGTDWDRVHAAHPEIRVRQAVYLDQCGETAAAKAILGDLVHRLGPDGLIPVEVPYLGYAMARFAALGGRVEGDVRRLLSLNHEHFPEAAELHRLGLAALAIAQGRPQDALELLRNGQTVHSRLGAAEVPRLRALVHVAEGDYAAAYAADREVAYLLAHGAERVYDLFVDGITARLNFDELRRRYADEAQTDPLTGLPNRRYLERHVAQFAESNTHGVLGVADVDGFKQVNTVHGHLVGDEVLQQIAAILSRTLRSDDFLARYGGDEFVIVLPGAAMDEAREIASRMAAAVAANDWSDLAPGTPVTLTMGLAALEGQDPQEAFRTADLLMLEAKRSHGTQA
ncbi:GGDEF domain-containing protein [Actinospica durhamensis]|uniref:GGDEF domain-containing protein n=1 Tax=Actinospica durhamensis TaxID=1508375 RepID=A0A941ERE6_9ACTN|nr:GGDEF domain-containing protein [Actinospica durhamensis]MBR7836612.1 GGDEF domain-containing protein [Actinospica durhamensis]